MGTIYLLLPTEVHEKFKSYFAGGKIVFNPTAIKRFMNDYPEYADLIGVQLVDFAKELQRRESEMN